MILAISALIFSFILLYVSSENLFSHLMKIASYLGWREFIISFFLMALLASLPNLWIGIISAFQGIPILSLGDITGNHLIVMTLGIGLATLFSQKGIPTNSRTIKNTALFTFLSSLILLLLMLDKNLSRLDGVILILVLLIYLIWLFSKKERFILNEKDKNNLNHYLDSQNNKNNKNNHSLTINKEIHRFRSFLYSLLMVIVFGVLLSLAAYGIVYALKIISSLFNFPLILAGILISGVANSLPEISFAIVSAKKKEDWLILGDLLGSIFISLTVVLSIVVLIHPINLENDWQVSLVPRILNTVILFIVYLLTLSGGVLSKKEGGLLILLYSVFIYLFLNSFI